MTPSAPPPPPAAVTAFLRGVDRRARLLARVQAGDEEAARRALAVTAQVFAGDAAGWPMSQWPLQFWRLLLSVPAMGRGVARPAAGPLPGIARPPPPARAAVLLHLVAGLEDADAAAALDLPVATYQGRIRDALPRDALGQPDLDVWRAWSAAVKRTLEALPDATPTPLEAISYAAGRTARRRQRWLWLGVLLCALALAATFVLHPGTRAAIDVWRQRVQVQPLPPADPPKARFDPADPALQPDRALLAAPHELQLARRLPLLAWLAADAAALPPADPAIAPATADAPPDATELARRTQAWERLAPAARAQARAAWAEWQALTDAERTQLRAIAARFDALPAADQQALRERYAQQPFDAHRGWHLGPQLGRDWPRIAPLFAFVAAGERAALLQLLRELSGDDLAALARLAQTTPPQARAALRHALLAEPPARRSVWLQAQLQR